MLKTEKRNVNFFIRFDLHYDFAIVYCYFIFNISLAMDDEKNYRANRENYFNRQLSRKFN